MIYEASANAKWGRGLRRSNPGILRAEKRAKAGTNPNDGSDESQASCSAGNPSLALMMGDNRERDELLYRVCKAFALQPGE